MTLGIALRLDLEASVVQAIRLTLEITKMKCCSAPLMIST